MTYLERAIKDAVKGGYMPPAVEDQDEIPASVRYFSKSPHRLLIDPDFWQALGKERGWENHNFNSDTFLCVRCGVAAQFAIEGEGATCFKDAFIYYWHRLIDHSGVKALTAASPLFRRG